MVLRLEKAQKQAPAKSDVQKSPPKVSASKTLKALWKKAGKPSSLRAFARTHAHGAVATSGQQWFSNKS